MADDVTSTSSLTVVVAALGLRADRNPADHDLHLLIGALMLLSPEFANVWAGRNLTRDRR
ncbi:hypothetical protein CIW52_22580 [Mycolicibacterium sp. P9-64]|uniref:MmyB family transcriptional regulator n=1 Tax=Mycolicibacterium sp. P9-64 TaxID=2024612 RepID=UPI0011EC70FE|nr:hypothetical protein [Mycolicibacterium sp. P9-64]KAA0081380.1 hypothetical protein CIW52_22580 [Mycolicibacterium sp. P9-64]